MLGLLCSFGLNAQSKGTILLASEKTRFKDLLIEELETLFVNAGYTIKKAEHPKGGLDSYKASDYRAVFITNSGVNSRVRPWVVQWIEKNRNSNAYILLHTTQIRDWTVKTDVDAVTSASANGDVKKLARDYFLQITRNIEQKGSVQ